MIPFFCKLLLIIAGSLNIPLFVFLIYRERKKEIDALRRMSGYEGKGKRAYKF